MTGKRLFSLKLVVLIAVLIVVLAAPLAAHAQQRVYVVQRGDNLYRIAARYGTTIQAIMNANGLRNANFIWVGQRLIIPGSGSGGGSGGGAASGGIHVVQRGEILATIAARYGTTVQAFVNANGLRNANFIWVGQRLRIPGGGEAAVGAARAAGALRQASGSR